MEHIDALEAVRRLTLERDVLLSVVVERDALAEQVRRLEAVLNRQAGEAHLKLNASRIVLNESTGEWEPETPQAPERRDNHKTGTETGEGGNGAPRGCNVPSWGKIARDVIWCASLALQNEIRLADTRKDWDELRRLQKGKMALDRIRDELSAH